MKTHREIAEQLDLFHSEPHAPGMIFWHPNGWRLFQTVQDHMRRMYRCAGFEEVNSPVFMKRDLWQQSGHLAMFAENMFFGGASSAYEKKALPSYVLKPMSCPAHILMFKRGVHSERDLPVRLFEFGLVHRNEASGSLNGCLRARQFTQDDAHVFCTWSQAVTEIQGFLQRAKLVYQQYGFEQLEVKLSTQPEKALGDSEDWNKAQEILNQACLLEGVESEIQVGEGAFYGPKIELALQDSVGRRWQCGTIQFDFNLAERFQLKYIAGEGETRRPVILHQAMYGSLERWVGILLEVSQGNLPDWLHPRPFALTVVSKRHQEYATSILAEGLQWGIRMASDLSDSSLARKMKRFHKQKIPYLITIGDQEIESNTVAIKIRKTGDIVNVKRSELTKFMSDKVRFGSPISPVQLE